MIPLALGEMVLLNKAQTSAVSGTRRIRVLIASGNPERIMAVRESLHAWPETMASRVALTRADVEQQLESHAPHILCWDEDLGAELPATARGICTLLLREHSCKMPEERPWEMALPDAYVSGLRRSINREYELRRSMMQLRDAQGSEPQRRLLWSRATDGLLVLDGTHQVLFANPAACDLLDLAHDELVGNPFELEVPEAGSTTSLHVQTSDGAFHSLAATAFVAVWEGRDATILQLQKALRSSIPPSPSSFPPANLGARVSEDRLRTVGRLAAGLAHEVNNPLTFVLANLESLRESHQQIRRFVRKIRLELSTHEVLTPQSFDQISHEANLQEVLDDAADMLTDCHKGMHRIQEIARSLGTFSRADDNQAELVDITRIVDDACAMVFNQIRYRARLVKRFDPVRPVAVFPGRIAQALVNLLTNAAEAIDGGAYDRHRIVVSTREEEGHVIVAVSDTGIGIPDSDRDRIFTPGFTTKANSGGMGMGLSSCQRVAEEHQGRLDVHPLDDGGTRFELVIPFDTGLSATEERRESRPISEAPLQRSRILIIDDDAMVLSALRRRLQRRCDTVTVLGGVAVLARLSEDPGFDSIVCDLMMPEIDGKSFYDAVRKEHPELAERIIFMSGGAFTPRLRKFAAAVPNPVLQKPVSREDLEALFAVNENAEG